MVGSLDRRNVLTGTLLTGVGAVLLVNPTVAGVSVIPPCPLKSLTGLDCPLCGGTRAVRSLLAGDLPAALDYNLIVTVGALLAVIAGVWWLAARAWPDLRADSLAAAVPVRTAVMAAIVVLAVFFVARNLPFVPYLGSAT